MIIDEDNINNDGNDVVDENDVVLSIEYIVEVFKSFKPFEK